MVLDLSTDVHDLGSGTFAPNGTLIGVDSDRATYFQTNGDGQLYGSSTYVAYEQPVWMYRQWILDTINGAGSSGSASSPAPSGQSLTETSRTETPAAGAETAGAETAGAETAGAETAGAETAGDLPMTLPPQTGLCPATGSCIGPDPGWKTGVLLGAGNYRGTALARCATTTANTCSLGDVATPAGTSARLQLGSASAPAPGTRQVMAWCKTTTPFPSSSSPAQTVLRVSLTNADSREVQPGFGWWDVTPDQVGTGTTQSGNSQTQLDTTTLPAC